MNDEKLRPLNTRAKSEQREIQLKRRESKRQAAEAIGTVENRGSGCTAACNEGSGTDRQRWESHRAGKTSNQKEIFERL